MKAIRYEKDAVLIQSGKIKAWVDVWIEKEDVICDWNKYIFFLDEEKDVALKKWQENLENFETARSLAVETLVAAQIIYQDKSAKWHIKNK